MSGAKKEMQNPILARIGAERAAGFAATVGILGPLAVWGTSQAYGFTKEKTYGVKRVCSILFRKLYTPTSV